MATVSKKLTTNRKAKNLFKRIVDVIPAKGVNKAAVKSFATAELDGDTITVTSTYYSESTLLDFLK